MTRLFDAILYDEPHDVILDILKRSPELIQEQFDRTYPLSFAVRCGSPVAIVQSLYYCWPESVRAKDDWGGWPLHYVSSRTPVETVEFLIDVYPEALFCMSPTGLPIHRSIIASRAVTQLLVERCPDSLLLADHDGYLPIHRAAMAGFRIRPGVIDLLADQCPESLLITTPDGKLPVHTALLSWSGTNAQVIQRLTVEGIPEDTRLGLMHFLVRAIGTIGVRNTFELLGQLTNFVSLVEALPATVRATDSEGSLPIHIAVRVDARISPEYRLSLVRPLVTTHPESLLHRNDAGELPLHACIHMKVAEFLYESAPQSALEAGRDGNLPIHTALANRWFGLVKRIVEIGPPGSQGVGARGRTPIHVAATVQCEDQTTICDLLDAADVLVRSSPESLLIGDADGNLPIHVAIDSLTGEWACEFVQFLIERNPDSLREAGEGGRLPLHVAVSQTDPSTKLVKLLVDGWNGALDIPDASGMQPLLLAHANVTAPLDLSYLLLRSRPDWFRSRTQL